MEMGLRKIDHLRCGIRAWFLRVRRKSPYPDIMFWAPWSRGDAELLVETKEKLGKKKGFRSYGR